MYWVRERGAIVVGFVVELWGRVVVCGLVWSVVRLGVPESAGVVQWRGWMRWKDVVAGGIV